MECVENRSSSIKGKNDPFEETNNESSVRNMRAITNRLLLSKFLLLSRTATEFVVVQGLFMKRPFVFIMLS